MHILSNILILLGHLLAGCSMGIMFAAKVKDAAAPLGYQIIFALAAVCASLLGWLLGLGA